MAKILTLSGLGLLASSAAILAQQAVPLPEPPSIIVTADGDPIIAAIRADALEHRGKVVSQTCILTSQSNKRATRRVNRFETEGPNAFSWQIVDFQIDGKPASDKEWAKAREAQAKRNKKRKAEDEERYGEFAEMIADKERIEKLPPQDGLLRYRINRLPKRMAKDLPSAIADQLKPVLWIADAAGEPYVQRLQVNLSDIGVYLIARVNKANIDVYFERRADGFVKERRVDFDISAKIIFQSTTTGIGEVACDAGGAPVKYVSAVQ